MKVTMKRVFSLLLCLCMVLQYIPATAFAAETDNLCEHHSAHTAECGYEAGVTACGYHCDICLGHSHEEEAPDPVCDCGTDDALIHAVSCAVYVAPETAVCYCTEKCTEINEWCDVCGFDYAQCGGADEAAAYVTMTGGETLYLKPNSNWLKDGARFAIYVYGTGGAWASMTDDDGDGIYSAEVPSGSWTNVLFCRMNGSTTENDWTNKWNQSADLIYDGTNNLCTINDGEWDSASVVWSKMVTGYSVTVSASENGTVTADKGTAAEGETVTLTVNANVGYLLETLTVGGEDVTAQVGNNTYSFPMPGSAVTVGATFQVCHHESYTNGFCTACGAEEPETDPVCSCETRCSDGSVNGQCAVCTAEVSDCTGAEASVTVYFDNATGWATVNAYYWRDSGSTMTYWPGDAMTDLGGGIWSVAVPADAVNIIFNDGGTTQTADLTIPTDGKNCFKVTDNLWYTYPCSHSFTDGACTVCGTICDHSESEHATAADKGDGTHSFTCTVCEDTVVVSHTFSDGACTVCGIIGGYCGGEGDGTNLVWTLNDGTLTVSGAGAMGDYTGTDRPWQSNRNNITMGRCEGRRYIHLRSCIP